MGRSKFRTRGQLIARHLTGGRVPTGLTVSDVSIGADTCAIDGRA